MSNSSSYWNVLSLTGEREIIEIITSLIQDQSLGCIDTDQKLSLYFEPEKKSEIDALINSAGVAVDSLVSLASTESFDLQLNVNLKAYDAKKIDVRRSLG